MQLAIVGRRLCEPLTGVGRYLEYLLRYWGSSQSQFSRIVVYAPSEPNLSGDVLQPRIDVRVIPSRLSPQLWENVVLPAKIERFDLIFAPYTLPWSLAHRGVVSNLGIYEARPKDFSVSERLRSTPFFHHSTEQARLVLANSESTRRDLVRFYGINPSKIRVVYPGVAGEFQPPAGTGEPELPEQTLRRLSIPPGPFFLFVGKLSRRRNVPLLMEAFRELKERRRIPHSLVIVGPDTAAVHVPQQAAAMSIGNSVVYLPYADRPALIELYRAAAAHVLPTLHEGFSFTMLEAMACGAPCVVFDHAALEGGMRQAALVIKKPGTAGLREALWDVANQSGLRERLRQAGFACAARFSWQKAAKETTAALLHCLEG